MSRGLEEEKLVDVSNDLGSLRNDLKGLYYALKNDWDRELEELLSIQGDQEIGPKYHLKYRKNFIQRIDDFKTAEDLVEYYNSELKDRSGLDTRFVIGKVREGKGEDLVRNFESINNRTALVRDDNWAVDIYRTLSKADGSSRRKGRRAAQRELEDVRFKDFLKPWKKPKYAELKQITADFKYAYWENYEQESLHVLKSVILQSATESVNPDEPAKLPFYRGLVEEFEMEDYKLSN